MEVTIRALPSSLPIGKLLESIAVVISDVGRIGTVPWYRTLRERQGRRPFRALQHCVGPSVLGEIELSQLAQRACWADRVKADHGPAVEKGWRLKQLHLAPGPYHSQVEYGRTLRSISTEVDGNWLVARVWQ